MAVVLRTVAGHLQLSRYALEKPELRTACFADPDEALRFLDARRSVRLPDEGRDETISLLSSLGE